jgi:resuscitation-promoting factor RpfA
MSELPHDDVERDSKLTAMYRAAAQDAPPAALDAAILAAAHREARARPWPAGFAFAHSWHVPLSIAAVVVLSVSLVTVMREEAPELTEPPRARQPTADPERKPAASADSGAATSFPGFVPDEQRSKNIGLKPPQPMPSPSLGMRQPGSAERGASPRRETMADSLQTDATAPAELAKRRDAPANVIEQRNDKPAAAPLRRQAAAINAPKEDIAPPSAPASVTSGVAENKTEVRSQAANIDRAERDSRFRAAPEPAPVAEKQSAEAPPAPTVDARPAARAKSASPAVSAMGKLERPAELPPEKWLERIEELRRQGKFDEAKASLAEFRKRFPEYRLPDALRDWGNR